MDRINEFGLTSDDSNVEEGRDGAFADDDSIVSSNVTNEEAQTLTRGGPLGVMQSDAANENNRAGIMPRNRREWCIVIFALLLIVAAAAGTGIGLGFYFMNQGSNTNNPATGNPKDGKGNENGNDDSYSDGSEPETDDKTDSSAIPLPTDFAGSVQYHMIAQDISELASFESIADNGSSSSPSPQQRARDWLVFEDMTPENLADEQDEQKNPNNGTDDLVDYNNSLSSSYLDVNTPAYRVAQRFAIAALYFSTEGEEWDTGSQWLQPGLNECDYPGIRCEEVTIPSISLKEALKRPNDLPRHSDGTVDTTTERMIVEINLPESNLGGMLPGELMTFPFLRRLGLWSNQIGGQIPENIGRLQNLESLLLDDNNFTGDIVPGIGSLENLKMLSLGFNPKMGGGIPREIGDLYHLEALYLPNMSLRGGLPSSMRNLGKLKNLELQSNNLRGVIPDWLGDLVNLVKLNLSGNDFDGEIPEGLSKLINLRELELQDNDLGTIPCSSFESVVVLSANCKSSDGTSCDCCTLCT
mmetsp:Transcript_7733/g.12750  ORF Transcript_7733/g.12750 Transcript_7733/m.12750 type:complete len:527 (+) Transcript_7733:66-1646(+)